MDEAGVVLTILLHGNTLNTYIACVVFLFFIIISAMMIMNMLIGLLCEVMMAVSKGQRDEADAILVKHALYALLEKYGNADGCLTRKGLSKVMRTKRSKDVLSHLNVDELFVTELQTTLFKGADTEVPIKGIIELMLMCRGDMPCTVQHMATGQAFISVKMDRMVRSIKSLEEASALKIASIEKTLLEAQHREVHTFM